MTSSTVSGTSRTYAYSGDGLLQSRTTGGSTVSFLWDPATSPARLLVSGSDKIVYGLGPLYSVNGSTVATYARDGQKSIRAELSGTSVTSSWRYRAYGDVVQYSGNATPSVLGYGGQLLDASGLYYMRARWYDPVSARFASRDPLLPSELTLREFNGYGYAGANPVTFRDSSGLALTSDGGCMGSRCSVTPLPPEAFKCIAIIQCRVVAVTNPIPVFTIESGWVDAGGPVVLYAKSGPRNSSKGAAAYAPNPTGPTGGPDKLYRSGGRNPSNLADPQGLSARTSLSEPFPPGSNGPIFKSGGEYIEVDRSLLPEGGSVVVDDDPEGHALIFGNPEAIREAITFKGRMP